MTPTVRAFLDELGDALGIELDPEDLESDARQARRHRPDHRRDPAQHRQPDACSSAGYKVNVIPGEATAHVDGRFLPGLEERVRRRRSTRCSARDVKREYVHCDKALETTFDGRAGRRDGRRAARPRTRAPARSRTCSPAAPTPSPSPTSASAASASPRCSCRRSWTSPACSTASTSGCRSRRCSSACACSTGFLDAC